MGVILMAALFALMIILSGNNKPLNNKSRKSKRVKRINSSKNSSWNY